MGADVGARSMLSTDGLARAVRITWDHENSTWPVVVRGASEGFTGANVPRVTRENCLSGEYTVGADLYSCGVCAGWRALLVWGPALLVIRTSLCSPPLPLPGPLPHGPWTF